VVVLGQLQRLEERVLGLFEPVQLEVDEAQVVVQRGDLGALRGQLAVDLLRLLELVLLEVDEAEQVEDVLVARPQQVRLLQLALRFRELALVVERLPPVEVGEEEPLVEGSARSRAQTSSLSRRRGSA
jgi:hypothetical protein